MYKSAYSIFELSFRFIHLLCGPLTVKTAMNQPFIAHVLLCGSLITMTAVVYQVFRALLCAQFMVTASISQVFPVFHVLLFRYLATQLGQLFLKCLHFDQWLLKAVKPFPFFVVLFTVFVQYYLIHVFHVLGTSC